MKSWNTPSIESISGTKRRNTASTQSMSSTGSLNTSSTDSIPEYRTPKYFKYSSIPEYRTTKYLKYKQYPEYSTPKYLKFKQYLEYWPPKYLEVQAVSTRVLGPEILGARSAWSASSIQSSIGPKNAAGTGRIRNIEPKHSQKPSSAQFKHLLASKPGFPAESPSLRITQMLRVYSILRVYSEYGVFFVLRVLSIRVLTA